MMDTPLKTVFYSIERAIKEYRKLVQRNLAKVNDRITVDQALTLMILDQDDSLSQRELADILFRDNASMTRTMQLMVGHGWLDRPEHASDGRRRQLRITRKGKKLLEDIAPVVKENRRLALKNISGTEQKSLMLSLGKIIDNCQPDSES